MKSAFFTLIVSLVVLASPAAEACSMAMVSLDALMIATATRQFASTFAASPGVRISKVRLEPSGLVIIEARVGGACQASAYSVSLKPDCSTRAIPAGAVERCQ